MRMRNRLKELIEKERYLSFLLISIWFPLGFNLNPAHAQSSKTSHSPERIVIAHNTPFNSTPIYMALEKGYFKPEIDVSLRGSLTGKHAIEDVVNGKADIATLAGPPFTFAVLEGAKVSIIATISETINSLVLVGLKDRGITTPGNLRGKKIGLKIGTSVDFFLDSILIFNGIAKHSVEKVDLNPDKFLSSLLKGEVDAVVSWDPFTHGLVNALGANGFTYYGDPTYNRYTWNLAARKDWIANRPETVKKVIQALIQGVNFIEKNPSETRKIVARYSQMDESEIGRIWGSTVFKVVLQPSLLMSLEDQARWAIRNKLTDAKATPNFLNHIYFDGLAAVNPSAVTIAH